MSIFVSDKPVVLDLDQRVRLVELLQEQFAGVRSGEISGYGQDREDELADIAELIELINSPA